MTDVNGASQFRLAIVQCPRATCGQWLLRWTTQLWNERSGNTGIRNDVRRMKAKVGTKDWLQDPWPLWQHPLTTGGRKLPWRKQPSNPLVNRGVCRLLHDGSIPQTILYSWPQQTFSKPRRAGTGLVMPGGARAHCNSASPCTQLAAPILILNLSHGPLLLPHRLLLASGQKSRDHLLHLLVALRGYYSMNLTKAETSWEEVPCPRSHRTAGRRIWQGASPVSLLLLCGRSSNFSAGQKAAKSQNQDGLLNNFPSQYFLAQWSQWSIFCKPQGFWDTLWFIPTPCPRPPSNLSLPAAHPHQGLFSEVPPLYLFFVLPHVQLLREGQSHKA